MDDEDRQMIRDRFKIVCRKCGSDDTTMDVHPGIVHSERTYDPPLLTIGCNACKQNDLAIDV